jgi:putative oxidoreductase
MQGIIPESWAPRLRSILRIVAAFILITHGTQKLFGVPAAEVRQPVELASLMGFAGVLEVFGGLAILLGLFTRPLAFVLSGEMAAAYFKAHAPAGFWPVLNRGETPVILCFVFLYLAAAGAGPWSLDALRTNRGKAAKSSG